MSFLPSARSASSDPLSSRLKRIQEELRRNIQDSIQIDDIDKQDANATDYSVLFWNDTASYVSAKPVTTAHLMPIEPDPSLVKWWYRHDHRGNFLRDESFNDNPGSIIGQPRLSPDGVDWNAFGGDVCSEYAYWTGGVLRDAVYGIKKPTLFNGATSSPNGVIFDGVDDYVTHGTDTTKWNNVALAKFSISLWITPTKMYDGPTRNITYMGWAANYSFIVYHYPTLARVYLEMIGSATPTRIAVTYHTGVTTPGTQYHIAIVYDSTLGSQRAKIYVNGTPGVQVTDTAGGALNNPSSALIQGGTSADFMGKQLDYRWWTNIALSQANITQLYNDGPLANINPSVPYPDYWTKENESGDAEIKYLSYIRVPDAPALRLVGLNNFSVSALVNMNSFELTNTQGGIWMTKADDATNVNAYQLQTHSDGRVYFICKVAGVLRNYMTTNPAIVGRNWYWIVGTYDGALADPKSKIYINGVVQPISISALAPQWQTSGTLDLLLGVGHFLDRGYNFGKMQDTRFYNRTLTATEILNMWNNKISITDIVSGQVATIGASPFNE